MKKKFRKLLPLLTLILFIFITVNPTKAESVFLKCRSPLKYINYKTSGFVGSYATALSGSLNHWATIPQVSVGTKSSAANTLTASYYSDSWYGLNSMTCSGSQLKKSAIKINTRTIGKKTNNILEETTFARSTITHEIAHSFGLADNPTPNSPNKSIMNHSRNRLSVYNLTSYDKANIDKLY